MKNIQKAIARTRKRCEYFQIRKANQFCSSCGCDPCDCDWGISLDSKIVISRRGNYEIETKKDKKSNS